MRFYCETYHEERDTEHCCFCSAACPQRPMEETVSGTGKETMRQSTEKTTIVFTYDEMPLEKLGRRVLKRRMDVYGDGETVKNELLFSETESVGAGVGKTKSGVACDSREFLDLIKPIGGNRLLDKILCIPRDALSASARIDFSSASVLSIISYHIFVSSGKSHIDLLKGILTVKLRTQPERTSSNGFSVIG